MPNSNHVAGSQRERERDMSFLSFGNNAVLALLVVEKKNLLGKCWGFVFQRNLLRPTVSSAKINEH